MNLNKKIIREIKEKYKLNSPGVFFALKKVPRKKFIPREFQHLADEDCAVSIGFGQTISQPYTVAFMTDLLLGSDPTSFYRCRTSRGKKVLEIGTGSGYQAAILAQLFRKVYTVERIPRLADRAKKILFKLGYKNVFVKEGQGENGWLEHAPYNAIVITAGIKKVPKTLFKQLKDGGILVAPVGDSSNSIMTRFIKTKSIIKKEEFGTFVFVPFVEG